METGQCLCSPDRSTSSPQAGATHRASDFKDESLFCSLQQKVRKKPSQSLFLPLVNPTDSAASIKVVLKISWSNICKPVV